jgi:hypothetical protein
METEGIDSVIVIPRTKKYANFYLNGTNEPHTLTYDDLFDYLTSLDKNSTAQIAQFISESRMFILFPKEHIAQILQPEKKSIGEIAKENAKQLREPPKKKHNQGSFIERTQAFIDKLSKR